MNNFQKYAIGFAVLVGLLLVACLSYKIGDKRGYNRGYNAIHPRDTVWKDSTIVKDSLIEVIKWKEKDKLVYVPVKVDSLIHDTTYVALPREFKVYADSTFEAQVSGIDPKLDWIKTHIKTAYITQTVVQNKPYEWTVSLYGEGEYVQNYLGAKIGVMYEKNFYEDMLWYIKVGYEYGNIREGWFGAAGVRIPFLHN